MKKSAKSNDLCSSPFSLSYFFALMEILASFRLQVSFTSPVDIHFWISDDVTENGLWAPQRRINVHIVFAALTF